MIPVSDDRGMRNEAVYLSVMFSAELDTELQCAQLYKYLMLPHIVSAHVFVTSCSRHFLHYKDLIIEKENY